MAKDLTKPKYYDENGSLIDTACIEWKTKTFKATGIGEGTSYQFTEGQRLVLTIKPESYDASELAPGDRGFLMYGTTLVGIVTDVVQFSPPSNCKFGCTILHSTTISPGADIALLCPEIVFTKS